MILNNTIPQVGDRLYRVKAGIVQHVGTYLGNNEVIHTVPGSGPCCVSLNEFSNNHVIKVVRSHISDIPAFFTRVNQVLTNTTPYFWLTDNCEHLASFLITGSASSEQIIGTALGSVALSLLSQRLDTKTVVIGGLLGLAATNILRSYD